MRRSTFSVLLILACTLVSWSSAAIVEAQTQSDQTAEASLQQEALKRFKAREVREDFLVPTSPAFAVLGVSPEQVIRPDTPRALGVSLLNGVDPKGHLQTGMAVDVAPVYLFYGRNLTLEDYRRPDTAGYLLRLANRLQFSLATTKGSSDSDKSVRLSTGLRVALWDDGDPRMSRFLDTCYDDQRDARYQALLKARRESTAVAIEIAKKKREFDDAVGRGAPALEVETLRGALADLNAKRAAEETKVSAAVTGAQAALQEIWSNCNKDFEKKSWNASNFTVGVAPVFFSADGQFDGLQASGVALYASLAYGFKGIPWLEDNSQVILHARYRSNEQVADSSNPGTFFTQDVTVVGAQIRLAGPDAFRLAGGRDLAFFGEFDYRRENRHHRADADVFRWAVGAELKVFEGTTLSLTVGDESGDRKPASGTFAVGKLKWAF